MLDALSPNLQWGKQAAVLHRKQVGKDKAVQMLREVGC